MTYSLVNMPVLGFDLARLPRGADAAEVLLAAMTLDGVGITRLTATALHEPAGSRLELARAVATRPPVTEQLDRLGSALGGVTGGGAGGTSGDVPAAVGLLERATLGTLDALSRLVRDELFAHQLLGHGASLPEARLARAPYTAEIDIVVDAVAARYAADDLLDSTARQLSLRWDAAALGAPALGAMDLGPFSDEIRDVLRAVAELTPARARDLRAEVDSSADRRGEWAAAMHEASWAVHVTERSGAAALAQLLTVRSFAASPLTARDAAYGVWNALSGLVHGTVVRDVLGERSADVLLSFWSKV